MFAIRSSARVPGRGLLLFVVVVLFHALYARHSVKVPFVFGDEAGYLLKAAALTGHVTDAYSSYYPAYALLIAPLFLLADQPLHIFHLVQDTNALLAGASAVLMCRLARWWETGGSDWRAWLAALVVSFYPSFMAFSSFALSENLFVPLAILLALSVLVYASQPGRRSAVLLGAACGALILIHPKGFVAAGSAMVAVLPVMWRERRRMDAAWVVATAAAIFLPTWLALDAFFKLRLGQVSNAVGGHYPDANGMLKMLSVLATGAGLRALLGNLLGQTFYLAVASLGLAVLGFGRLVRRLFIAAATERDRELRCYAVYAVLACMGTMLMTALFMHEGERIDQRFYGRYDEGVLALLMLPALMAPLRSRAWVGAAAVVLLAGLAAAWCFGDPMQGWLVEINVIGMQLWRGLVGGVISVAGLDIVPIALATVLLLLALSRLARSVVLPLTLLVVFMATSKVAGHAYLRPTSNEHARQHAIADYVKKRYPEVACVNYDRGNADYWARFNYQFFLLPLHLHETTLAPQAQAQAQAAGQQASGQCSDLVISSSAELQRSIPGARLLLRENGSSQALWQVPR